MADLLDDMPSNNQPQDSATATLCALASALLDAPHVDAGACFQDLGGTSLQAVRFVLRVEESLRMQLPVRAVLEGRTFGELANLLTPTPHPEANNSPVMIGDVSQGQLSLWLTQAMQPHSPFYNVFDLRSIHGPLDAQRLLQAAHAVAARHETLSLRFPAHNGIPTVASGPNAEIALVPVSNERALQSAASERVHTTFDLASGPLCRITLFQVSSEHHALLICMHHIISDAWSLGCMHREISQIYAGAEPAPIRPNVYRQLVRAEQAWVSSTASNDSRTYWREHLAGAPAFTELPLDKPRPAQLTTAGAQLRRALPVDLTQGLQSLATTRNTTLYTIMLTALAALLYRLTRTQDVVIGSPFAGRTRASSESLVGYFVNMLPLRLRADGNPTVSDLLQQAHEVVLSGFEHQGLPLTQIIEEANPQRSAAHQPLFQVIFALQNAQNQAGTLHLEGCRTSAQTIDTNTAKYDWSLFVEEQDHGLELHAEYNTSLFDGITVDRWLNHYVALLRGFVATPQSSALELPIAAEPQIAQPAPASGQSAVIHELFEQQAAATPNARAIADYTVSLTYEVLNRQANRLAHYLLAQGAAPGDVIAIALPRGCDAVVGMIAALKAGAAYLPIDPSYPQERLEYLLQDAGARVVITQAEFADSLPETVAQTLCLDRIDLAQSTDQNPGLAAHPDQLANVIYTSGSTGLPKGVAVPHRGVVRLVRDTNYLDFSPQQVFLQAAPLTFDAATFEIWGPLLNGGACAIVPAGTPDARVLAETISTHGATVAWLTASLFNLLVDEAPHALAGLRVILTGGEALSPRHVHLAQRALPDTQLINGYGPTENTTFTCCYQIPAGFPADARHVPIGQPIHGTYVRILDERRQVVPQGVPGELYIGGVGLAQGYINRQSLTDERFVADPFEPNQLLYRSGDLVRELADGNLEFLGRLDRQVKVRGHRIELEEIEAVVDSHPHIKECVADTLPGHGDTMLIAFVVPSSTKPSAADIRHYLGSKLPGYMVPDRIVTIDAIPLTTNGKADRDKLHALLTVPENSQAPARKPANDVERWLADTWQSLLGLDTVSTDDSFFDAGGTSLDALRLMERIGGQYSCELPLTELFASPTIAQLAERIAAYDGVQSWSPIVPIHADGQRPALFMVHAIGGSVVGFADFAKHLHDEQPLYGIQAYGLIDGQEPISSIPEMAARYVEHLRGVQPQGPYHLGGISMGGVIAYEMATQLEAAGEQVAYLMVGDTWFDHGIQRSPMRWRANKLLTMMLDVPRFFRRLRVDKEERRVAQDEVASRQANTESNTLHEQLKRVREVHHRAFAAYQPGRFSGDLIFLRTENLSFDHLCLERMFGPNMGWEQLVTGKVRRFMLPGVHHHICYFDNALRFAKIVEETLATSR